MSCLNDSFSYILNQSGYLLGSKINSNFGSGWNCGRLIHPLFAVVIKEIVKTAIGKSAVYFGAVHRYIAIGEFHSNMLPGVAVIMKFHVYSGTRKTTRELIPRLAAIDRLTDFPMKYRLYVLIFLFQWRVCQPIFVLDFLDNLVAPLVIVALVYRFSVHIHAVIYDVEMRMVGLQMAHNKILGILNSHTFHILLCELCHKFIGQSWRVGIVETDGDMTSRVLLAGHESVCNLKRLHHSFIVQSEDIVTVNNSPSGVSVLAFVVKFAGNVANDIVETSAFKYSCKHRQSLY